MISIKGLIEFKGTKNGIVIQLKEAVSIDELLLQLNEKLGASINFFKGANICGLVGVDYSYGEKAKIEALLNGSYNLAVDSLEDPNKEVKVVEKVIEKVVTKTIEVPVEVEKKVIEKVASNLGDGAVKLIRGTMRSGRSVDFQGHVVVIGDVNPGAEIIAEGNIVIFGQLRGVAHAGAKGNDEAFIVAQKIKPTQLRIAKLITRPPEDGDVSDIPEIALVKDGNIITEPCV